MAARSKTEPGGRAPPPWQLGVDSDQSAWKPGTHLGSFRLERLLGLGSFGEVWEAADRTVPDAPRRVAVKILSVVGVPGGLQGLQREAEICRELNHPNIIEILGVQASEEAAWIVMEFVPGPTLQQAVRMLATQGLRLPRAPLLDVGIGIARALEAAWGAPGRSGESLQIVHRNLRPAEVMLSDEGIVKVGGFSLARLAQDERKTATGGSPQPCICRHTHNGHHTERRNPGGRARRTQRTMLTTHGSARRKRIDGIPADIGRRPHDGNT